MMIVSNEKTLSILMKNLQNNNLIAAFIDMNFESNDEVITTELEKQRKKLNDMTSTLERQHQLLRLIIQVNIR